MNLDHSNATERRLSLRYEIELPFDMVLENGTILSVKTRNISSYGLQLVCDSWVTDEIEPRGIQNHAISHIRLKSIIELPIHTIKHPQDGTKNKRKEKTKTEIKKLYANCKIMSVQRMSQDVYMLNLAFVDFENASENNLDTFLNQHEQANKNNQHQG